MSIAQARTTLRGARPLWSHWEVEASGMYTKRSSSETYRKTLGKLEISHLNYHGLERLQNS